MRQGVMLGLLFVPLLIAMPSARADQIILRSVADTTLFAAAPGNSLGGSDSMAVGGNGHLQSGRGLVRFDVAKALPAGASIAGAHLEFTVTKAPAGAVPSTFRLHRMLRPWAEGRGAGNLGEPAATGDSTWDRRVHPGTPWSAPGGAAGDDYAAVVSGSVAVAGTGRYTISADALVADVLTWLHEPASEFGWMLLSDAEAEGFTARRVGTRESGASAPVLTIDYFVPVPPVLIRWGRVGDRFELQFHGEAGNLFAVVSRDALDPAAAWVVRTNYVVKLVPADIVFSAPIHEATTQFFAVADVGDVD